MKQQGMSLVEVMVAVAILGAGLLGLGALQSKSLVMNQSAYYRSVAADLAADLADRIRANRNQFRVWSSTATNNLPTGFPLPPDFAQCTQNSKPDDAPVCAAQTGGRNAYLVQAEMTAWNTALRAQLKNATYQLTSANAGNGFLRYVLTISWLDDRTSATNTSFTAVIE